MSANANTFLAHARGWFAALERYAVPAIDDAEEFLDTDAGKLAAAYAEGHIASATGATPADVQCVASAVLTAINAVKAAAS